MIEKVAPSFPISIFIAGDYAEACKVCRAFCFEIGLCVTVTPTEYIYTGGSERGVIVGLINYPRFPKDKDYLIDVAFRLADRLMAELYQHSYTVQTPYKTYWHSRRPA